MLQRLHIVNFAIIEDTVIELSEGATVFTGETGSGKSILMDALAILLGRRASVDLIRTGKDFFRVEGVFSADDTILPLLDEMGLDAEDGEIIVTRKMNTAGRGMCMVNGAACTVKQLERLGGALVKLHEQNDNAELLSSDFCRFLIDHSDEKLKAAAEEYAALYGRFRKLREQIEELGRGKQEKERRLDILQWEIEQIEGAEISDLEEDAALAERLSVMENHERIYTGLRAALEALTGDTGAQSGLAEASSEVSGIAEYDKALASVSESLQSALYTVEDAISDLESYASHEDFSEEELATLQNRDELLSQLKIKYGPTLADVQQYLEKARREYDDLHALVYDSEELKETLRELTAEVQKKAGALNALRREKGKMLCQRIEASLHEMSMEHATMELRVTDSEVPTAAGAANVDFYFSANPGEPPRPMRQVASGGEISRISLAIEDIFSDLFACRTLVFDEIDTGISGGAALRVAKKIASLAKRVQLLCITHMPQTASIADAHYAIRKTVEGERTISAAVPLSEEEGILDVAWMISGNNPPSESAIASARDLRKQIKQN